MNSWLVESVDVVAMNMEGQLLQNWWNTAKAVLKGKFIALNVHIKKEKDSGDNNPVCETAKETQMHRTVFWTLWERERVG